MTGKSPSKKQKVLFYCRCNSVCSQMAEAFLSRFFPEGYEAHSAGIMAAEIHPAVRLVMAEIGIDISKQRSKNIEEFIGTKFDLVALVCGSPPDHCPFLNRVRGLLHCDGCQGCCRFFPFFPVGARILHTHFREPVLGPACDETTESFRKLRDEIREWVMDTFG